MVEYPEASIERALEDQLTAFAQSAVQDRHVLDDFCLTWKQQYERDLAVREAHGGGNHV